MNVDVKSGTHQPPHISKVSRMLRTSRIVKNASSASHMGGLPRRVVLTAVGSFAKLVTSILNRTRVYNMDTLLDLVQSRPPGTPLVTVSNHMSTIDDPLMWGLKGLPVTDSKLSRWTLTAEDICFTNPVFSYFFRLGKCIPIKRGAGIYQPYMNEALDVINGGDWLHTFPEGKLSQEEAPMRRLKWGVASLIARAAVRPIVLPIAHSGFEKVCRNILTAGSLRSTAGSLCPTPGSLSPPTVFPENFWYGKRPPFPLFMKHISIVVGEPIVFDIPQLMLAAKAVTANVSCRSSVDYDITTSTCMGSSISSHPKAESESTCLQFLDPDYKVSVKQGRAEDSSVILDEDTANWMYAHMSENLRCVLQDLALKAKSINKIYG